MAKSRVDDNSRNIEEIRRLLEDTRKEMREQTNKTEGRPDGEDDGNSRSDSVGELERERRSRGPLSSGYTRRKKEGTFWRGPES